MLPPTPLLLHFWLPLALLPLALALALARDSRRKWMGRILTLGCIIAILMHDWEFATTQEGQVLHLALSIGGPTLLCAVGCLMALFGGPTPFAPLPEGVREAGFLLLAGGFAWFGWLLFAENPQIAGATNEFWLHHATSLLTMLIVIGGFASAFTVMMGDRRWREAGAMGGISVFSFLLLIYLLAQGTAQDGAALFRGASWGALGDLAGMALGTVAALLLFVLVVWIGERNMPVPEPVAPLSDAEEARVREILESSPTGEGGSEE